MKKNLLYGYLFPGMAIVFLWMVSCGSTRRSVEAEEVPHTLSAMEQRKADYFFLEANRLKNNGKYDAAFDMYVRTLETDSLNAAALFELANFYLQLKRVQQTYDLLQKAVRIEPENYWYNLMYAGIAQNLNLPDQAITVYNRLIPLYPDKPELNYMLAEVYAQAGEIQKAVDALDRLEESTGLMESLSLEKFKLYKALENDPKAFAEINRLVKAYPHDVRYLVLLGDLYMDAERKEEAWQAYQKATELEPDNGYLLVSKANYYNLTGNREGAKKQINEALRNEKIDVDTKVKILTTYLSLLIQRKEDAAQADGLFDMLIDRHPQEEALHKLYADFLLSRQEFGRAREQLEIAVDLAPTQADYWLQLMGIAFQDSDYVRATEIGEKALTYVADRPEIYFYLGAAYGQTDNIPEAIRILNLGIGKTEDTNVQLISDFYAQLGDLEHKAGRPDQAYAMYDKALLYNNKNTGVMNNYSYFLSLEKRDLQKAERMIGEAIKLEPNNSTFLDTYGWVFFQQGNYTLAKIYLQSALNKGGDKSPEILEHYGDVLYMSGDEDDALNYWKRALEAGSESAVLKKKIETKKYHEP